MAELRPDLLVVPECEQPTVIPKLLSSVPVNSFHWVGPYPKRGLGVLGYGEYSCSVHPSYDPRHRWILPINVTGPRTFLLMAVWTVPHLDSGLYVQSLCEAFEEYEPVFSTSEVMWAGDFNAGIPFDRPSHRHKFRDFLDVLRRHGSRSLYHEHRGCALGEEPEPTYFHRHKADKSHHIDYVFASGGFQAKSFEVSVGSHALWSKLSDHMPLICDFYESGSPQANGEGANKP